MTNKKETQRDMNTSENKNSLIKGVVYYHRCTNDNPDLNGKYYVGVTPDEKTRLQKWNYWKNPQYAGKKLQNARNLTVPEDWEYSVIEQKEFSNKDDYDLWAKEKESEYIEKYDSFYHGFNGNKGGTGMCSDGFTPELRARIGKTSKGRKMPPESVAKRAAKLRGRKNTPETIEKMKNAPRPPRTPEQRAAQSARMKGKNPVAATEAAKKWQAENPGGWWSKHPILPESIEKRKITVREKAQRIKVTDSNNVETCYSCQTDAAKATGVADGSIKYALDNTKGLHAKSGYRFERISDDEYQEWERQNRA